MNNSVAEYKSHGLKVYGYLFDVTDEAQVIHNINKIEKEVGSIVILVNNAEIIKRTPLEDMEVDDFEQVLKVDLVSPFIMSKHIVKSMNLHTF